MSPREDPLPLLLPDASEARLDEARRVTTFLRLLGSDARSPGPSAAIDVERAACELERDLAARASARLLELLRAHLQAALSPDAFAWFGAPTEEPAALWRALVELGAERPDLPGPPDPGEPPLAVAERLLAALGADVDPDLLDLWRVRLLRVRDGARAAEPRLEELERRALRPSLAAAVRVERAAAALDLGAPGRAAELLEHVAARSPRAARLFAFCSALLDEPQRAAAAGAAAGPVPAALVELRGERPDLLAGLAGPEPRRAGPRPVEPALASRRELGASVLALLAFEEGGARARCVDLAPALRERWAPWLAGRDGAWTLRGEPEQALFVEARVQRRFAPPGKSGVRGALGPGTRALALAPVLDDAGDVAGWLHLEFEHLLVPSTPRLEGLARAWAPRLRAASAAPRAVEEAAPLLADDPRLAWARALLDAIGVKTAHRRWWLFDADEPARPVAEGGAGLAADPRTGEGSGRSDGARGLARAATTRGLVRFDEPAPALSVHPAAASGLALPLVVGDRVVGTLALESERRRDFRASDAERFERVAAGRALGLRVAQLRAWHRRRFGVDVSFDPGRRSFRAFAGRFVDAARSRAPVAFSGPPGSGKRVLGRWLHFESAGPDAPLATWHGDPSALGADREGTLWVDDLERLDERAQAALLEHLEGPHARRGPRVAGALRTSLADAAGRGTLRRDLATVLERLEVRVPPLARRRAEIPRLVAFLAQRFAREEDLAPPTLADEALALLFRQTWEGNLRELENVVFKLVLHARGEALDPAAVRSVAAAYGIPLVRRLPSRHPERADVLAAIDCTRTSAGRPNRRRAALYLGWDPDTLVARLADLGLEQLPDEGADGWDLAAGDPPGRKEGSPAVSCRRPRSSGRKIRSETVAPPGTDAGSESPVAPPDQRPCPHEP